MQLRTQGHEASPCKVRCVPGIQCLEQLCQATRGPPPLAHLWGPPAAHFTALPTPTLAPQAVPWRCLNWYRSGF